MIGACGGGGSARVTGRRTTSSSCSTGRTCSTRRPTTSAGCATAGPASAATVCCGRCSARHVPEWDGDPGLWFMDYRNADGSVAQMCGNGARVFVRYLLDEGLASGPDVDVATRAGLKPASVLVDGRVRVGMGTVRVDPGTVRVTTTDGSAFDATPVDVGNPHAVSFVPAVAGHRSRARTRSGTRTRPSRRASTSSSSSRWASATSPCGSSSEGWGRRAPAAPAPWPSPRPTGSGRARATAPGPSTCPAGRSRWSSSGDQAYLTGPAVLVAHGEVSLPNG